MPKILISSDGTVSGTEVTLDGTKLTDEEDVVSTYFSASVRYGTYVSFDYSSREENPDGSYEIVSYNYYKPDDIEEEPVIRRSSAPSGLGKEVAEDEELLNSDLVLGAKFHTEQVIDKSMINPNHRGVIGDIIRGKSYRLADTTGE